MSAKKMMRCPGTGHEDCRKCVSKRAHKGDSNCKGGFPGLCEACKDAKCIPVTRSPRKSVPTDKTLAVCVETEGAVSLMGGNVSTFSFSKQSDALRLVKAIRSAMKGSK